MSIMVDRLDMVETTVDDCETCGALSMSMMFVLEPCIWQNKVWQIRIGFVLMAVVPVDTPP
jgi:hypothetical protein